MLENSTLQKKFHEMVQYAGLGKIYTWLQVSILATYLRSVHGLVAYFSVGQISYVLN